MNYYSSSLLQRALSEPAQQLITVQYSNSFHFRIHLIEIEIFIFLKFYYKIYYQTIMPLVYRTKFALSPIQEQCESPVNHQNNGQGDLMEKNNNQFGENGYPAKGQNGCHVNQQNGHHKESGDFEKENLTTKVNLNESPEIDELSLKLGLFNFDMLKKLPLRHQWTAWQWDMEKDANGNPINALQVIGNWEHALKQKDTFDTVEDFWRVYHLIKPVDNDQVKLPADYSIFKTGIKPMWEDPANMDGGRWLLVFRKDINKKPSSNLEIVWLEVV